MSYRGFALSPSTPLGDRVLYYVAADVEGHCWEWIGAVDKVSGYGLLTFAKRKMYAHRAAYMALVGPISSGLQIDHLCRNRQCNIDYCRTYNSQRRAARREQWAARGVVA